MGHQQQVTIPRQKSQGQPGGIMTRNEMLGKMVHSEQMNLNFEKSEDIFVSEFSRMIRDFKADMNGSINTIPLDMIRGNISAVFNNHIVKLENKIYSLQKDVN